MPDTASPSTAIDLSRLPAPTVVETLSFEGVYAELVAYLQQPDVLPAFDATVESDPAVKILQVAAWRETVLRAQFNDRLRQVMLAFAGESNLDHLGALVNVERLLLDEGDEDAGVAPTYESDDDFRRRIQLAPESFTCAGPESAYRFRALSADATIRDASAIEGDPGQVIVTLLSRVGDGTADEDQIAAVSDVLGVVEGNRVRPLGDQVIVQSAEIVPYEIEAELTLYSGPDETVVLAAAQAGVEAWKAKSGMLGLDAVRAAIIAALFVEGVQNVILIQPDADVVVDRTQATDCVGTSVTVAGHGA